MYIGRFLVVGPGHGGYRVSSRSFPNREIVDRDGRFTVRPTKSASPTDNPYVSYNCLRFVNGANAVASPVDAEAAVIGNGSHVDPIAEKISMSYPDRDALVSVLLALDYEHDDYKTPRIAGIIRSDSALIGIVRHDGLIVETVTEPTIIATYETIVPEPTNLTGDSAESIAQRIFDADYEHPVCSIGVARAATGFESAIVNG